MERAAAHQVCAGYAQLDPRCRHEGLQGHLHLQPLDLLVSDAGHRSSKKSFRACCAWNLCHDCIEVKQAMPKASSKEATHGDRMAPVRGAGRAAHGTGRTRSKALRNEQGWSQSELAEQVGADPAQISRYENGRITPSADALVRLAETFGVSCDYLLVDDAPRRPFRSPEDDLGDHLADFAELRSGRTGSWLSASSRRSSPRPV